MEREISGEFVRVLRCESSCQDLCRFDKREIRDVGVAR